MTRIFGFFSLRNFPAPLTVPPVPAPAMKCVTLPLGLLPDFGAGGAVVGLGVDRIVELVGQHRARRVLDDLLGLHDVVVGMIGRHGGRRDDHLGAVRLEQADLFLRHLVGHREDAAIALERRGHGDADAGVAAGPLDDRPAGLEVATPLGVLDDGEPDPVLDRPAGVGVLRLAVDGGADAGADPAEPDERGPADGLEDVVVGRLVGMGHGVTSSDTGMAEIDGLQE